MLARLDIGALKQDVAQQAESVLASVPLDKLASSSHDVEREFNLLDEALASRRQGFAPPRTRWNPSKDMCQDVLPYVEHRAQTLNGGYINASLMPRNLGRQFIAAQGPLKGTVADFWSMIANHRAQQIVALCGDDECAEYLPSEGKPLTLLDGALELTWKSEEAVAGIEGLRRSRVELQHGADRWEVTRLHFSAWNDHGTIAPEVLLQIVEAVEAEAEAPAVVHCRAGAGRTGCLIAVCGLVAGARRQLEGAAGTAARISVPQAVVDLRTHRPHMVQTDEQYRLIYEALAAWHRAPAPASEPSKACPVAGGDKPQEPQEPQEPHELKELMEPKELQEPKEPFIGAASRPGGGAVKDVTIKPTRPVLLRPVAEVSDKRSSLWSRRFGAKDAKNCVLAAEVGCTDAETPKQLGVECQVMDKPSDHSEESEPQQPAHDLKVATPMASHCVPSSNRVAEKDSMCSPATMACSSPAEFTKKKTPMMDIWAPTKDILCELNPLGEASAKQLLTYAGDLSLHNKAIAEQQLWWHMTVDMCMALSAGLLGVNIALQLALLREAERV